MFWLLPLLLTAPPEDPRIPVVELVLEGHHEEALKVVERSLAEEPEIARPLGLDYLQGRLLQGLGRPLAAAEAFASAIDAVTALGAHSRYRLALVQEELQHPEVAAGLIATVLAGQPPSSLVGPATELLRRSLSRGGDCRLLLGLSLLQLPASQRRQLQLADADCAIRDRDFDAARNRLIDLLDEACDDEAGREAADRLLLMRAERAPDPPLLIMGRAFSQHRQFDLALRYLEPLARSLPEKLRGKSDHEASYLLARSLFWLDRFADAAAAFTELAERTNKVEERAEAFYQAGRSYELLGRWRQACASFVKAYQVSSSSRWADDALLSAMRLEWRSMREDNALALYEMLRSRREWSSAAARGALFLASSELVRKRSERAGTWLHQAAALRPYRLEAVYWLGRWEEARGRAQPAVEEYLKILRQAPLHPLASAARRRLGLPHLSSVCRLEALRLAASRQPRQLMSAWLLLGDDDPEGARARTLLLQSLAHDLQVAPFLNLAQVPAEEWPLWLEAALGGEEMLLGLGLWAEGGTAPVLRHFPPEQPGLAFTASGFLSRSGATRESVYIAEILASRIEGLLPTELMPMPLRGLLYPLPHRQLLVEQSRTRGADPLLLAAIVREESRFDPGALSGAAARGLAQFVLPTARRVGERIGLGRLDADDLYLPDISIALGAAHLAELTETFGDHPYAPVAAYNAGIPQTRLWLSYCFSREPEEFFTKVGFRESRAYLGRVITSWANYRQIYPELASQ